MKHLPSTALLAAFLLCHAVAVPEGRVNVFVLAGDENMLRQGTIRNESREPTIKQNATGEPRAGSLHEVTQRGTRFDFLKNAEGHWAVRDDVALFDAHPLSNNTRDPAQWLQIPREPTDPRGYGVGVELALGHRLGQHLGDPVLLIRFATKHPIWFQRGARSLGYDYLPPSVGGGLDLDAGWDVIHFNFGVWDQQYLDPENPSKRAEPGKGRIRTPLDVYETNLRTIVARLKQTNATLIWAHTTPILVGTPPGYVGGEEVDRYNAAAAAIMLENGVLINDLNAECVRMGKPKALNVHDVGSLAPKVTQSILAALETRETPSRPLPRVLFIGDSITGSYWAGVQKDLDGKAFVAKNPGNAEHSGTGVRLLEQWIDPSRYLLNGQEYLEMIDGIKQTLADFDRHCPGFAGKTPELAGFVWFQGIADAMSEAHATAYEKNLHHLIMDVRKDLGKPNLPIVVAALGQDGEAMRPNYRRVHTAQLAIADHARYPAFEGNVAAINTIPFFFPADKSHGGRAWDYHSNSESFLLIGEAMATEMLRLLKE